MINIFLSKSKLLFFASITLDSAPAGENKSKWLSRFTKTYQGTKDSKDFSQGPPEAYSNDSSCYFHSERLSNRTWLNIINSKRWVATVILKPGLGTWAFKESGRITNSNLHFKSERLHLCNIWVSVLTFSVAESCRQPFSRTGLNLVGPVLEGCGFACILWDDP